MAQVDTKKAGPVASGDQAADKAFGRLGWGEAPAIGILGKSGTGKTEAARRLVEHYLRRSRGVSSATAAAIASARFSPC